VEHLEYPSPSFLLLTWRREDKVKKNQMMKQKNDFKSTFNFGKFKLFETDYFGSISIASASASAQETLLRLRQAVDFPK
jgi:hypothetical protein